MMTTEEVVNAVRQADATDDQVLDGLSRKLTDQAWAPIRALVQLAVQGDPKTFDKAAHVLSGIGDLAVIPLLDGPKQKPAPLRLWNLEMALAAHISDRDKIVAGLEVMLADKTVIDWATVGPVERAPQPSRVCDEAYLLMRRLLNVGEGRTASVHERNAFLRLSDQAKDDEIAKAKHSRTWTNVRDHDDDDEE
jgi:hypothetical protein